MQSKPSHPPRSTHQVTGSSLQHLSPQLLAELQSYLTSGGSAESLAEHLLMLGQVPTCEGVRVDVDRSRRCGYPEVVYGEGKSVESVRQAARRILEHESEVLITRCHPSLNEALSSEFPHRYWSEAASILRIRREGDFVTPRRVDVALEWEGSLGMEVAVVSAGTTDQRVAMEAAETLAWMGIECGVIQDAGIAGPYRIIPYLPWLRRCRSIVVVAGMEAALPGVLAAYVAVPVVAVPTSVGYGANFFGLAALLGILNSCAANVTVVNIDAGFKAGFVAGLMARPISDSIQSNE